MKFLLLLLVALVLVQPKLIYLAQLFRHGARYPVTDIYDGKDTKAFHGQLTSIGMRQHYLLGTYLKKDYVDKFGVFNATLNPKQVEIFTDSSQRCYQSAYAHAAGLFQLNQGEQIPEGISTDLLQPPFDLSSTASLRLQDELSENGQFSLSKGYQPVPIKTGEAYFPECPNQSLLIAKRVEAIATHAAQIQAEEGVFSIRMKSIFGLSAALANIAGMVELYDVVICDLNLGREMPKQFTEKDFLEMKYIQNYMFVLLYAENLARVVSTPIAAAVIDKMQKIISGKLDSKKLSIYSGHDTNVAPMLTFLNLTTAECVKRMYKNQTVTGNCAEPVPFASNIQFQLHQRDSLAEGASNYFVKIQYNGDYYLLCDSKSYECDFTEFASRVKHQLVDYHKECGTK